MSLIGNSPTAADIREIQQILSYYRGRFRDAETRLDRSELNIRNLLVSRATQPAAPVANLLWNGEVGHSVNSWHDTSYVVNNRAYEGAWWFSHNPPVQGVQTFTTITTADEIDITDHGFTLGSTVEFTTTGTLPTGLATGTTYYVIEIDADTFSVATSVSAAEAGTAVIITASTGSGTHTVQEVLDGADVRTTSVNNTLKTTDHTQYNARYSRWNSADGWGELTGGMTIDQILPSNIIDATTPLARVSLIAAKRSEYIELTEDCLMAAGIWDNTIGENKFLEGSVALTANVVGSPASTVERRYRVLIRSDRGYSILSDEVTLASAPQDGSFSTTDYVALSWRFQPGQLQVDVYEYLPNGGDGVSSAEYRLLTQISSASDYIHLGAFLDKTITGYPTTNTDTIRSARFYTLNGEMAGLATNGVSPGWSTVNFPIGVPDNYDKSNTTDRQWLRIWLTVAPNLFVEGCTTDGTTTITAPAAVFDAEYDTEFDAGTLVAEVYDSNDTLLQTTTIASRTDDENVVLGDSIASGSNRKLRIVGGGFHGVYIDKIHLGYQQNTSYAPNALDARTLQPVAAPTSSTQGGVGTGGSGGGINTCVAFDTPIKQFGGRWLPIESAEPGQAWSAGSIFPNVLAGIRPGFDKVREVVSANGCYIRATPTERFVTGADDFNGTMLQSLKEGDTVLTEIDGRIEASKIILISPLSETIQVFTPTLTDTNIFVGGELRPNFFQRIKYWILRTILKREINGGFVLHNLKQFDESGAPIEEPPDN